MKRGYFKTYVKTFFIILLICVVAIGVVYYLKQGYDGEQLETIKTNMLLIEAKTKIVAEKVKIKEKDAKYIGTKIEKDTEDAEIRYLQEQGIIDLNAKDVKYYSINQTNLEELGLSNITLEEGFYLVEYSSNEIIYSKGIENVEGTKLYKLSEIQKIESEEEKQIVNVSENKEENKSENKENIEGE